MDITLDISYENLLERTNSALQSGYTEDIVATAFHMRNIHGGKGSRQLFRNMMNILYDYDKSLVIALLPLIPLYGYWKDIFYLSAMLPGMIRPTMELCGQQLIEDEYSVEHGYPPSKMAKYIPKQKKKYKIFTTSFAKYLFPTINCHSGRMRLLRKRISALNRVTGAVEPKMCAKEWDLILPKEVPFLARKKYRRAFLNMGGNSRTPDSSEERTICKRRFEEFYETAYNSVEVSITSEIYAPVREALIRWKNNLNANN